MTIQSAQTLEQRFIRLEQLHEELLECVEKVNKHYAQSDYDKEESLDTSVRLAYRMALEYFVAATTLVSIKKTNLTLSAASLVRALIEVVADVNHITSNKSKQNRRAKRYKDSVDAYFTGMYDAALKMTAGKDYSIKYPNPWTDTLIQDRVSALGQDVSHLYDYFSAFTHANPGYQVYLSERILGESLRSNTLKAAMVRMIELLIMMKAVGVPVDLQELARINRALLKLG